MRKHIVVSLLFVLSTSGCSTVAERITSNQAGIDGETCVGSIEEPIQGLTRATNAALLAQAQFAGGKGGTCTAKVFSVNAPLVLYRVFDSTKPYSKFGSWWSLSRPTGTKDSYRSAFAICPEWSNLDKMVSCEARPGTELVIGTTQSANCSDGSTLPKTNEIQVFVPNNGKIGIYHVGACTEESSWP